MGCLVARVARFLAAAATGSLGDWNLLHFVQDHPALEPDGNARVQPLGGRQQLKVDLGFEQVEVDGVVELALTHLDLPVPLGGWSNLENTTPLLRAKWSY